MISRILYTSRSVHPIGHRTDVDILVAAERINRNRELSGFLLRGPRWFAQFLEGPTESLALVFDKIKLDDRHYELAHWDGDPSTDRLFPYWAMGYASVSEAKSKKMLPHLSSPTLGFAQKACTMRSIADTYLQTDQAHILSGSSVSGF